MRGKHSLNSNQAILQRRFSIKYILLIVCLCFTIFIMWEQSSNRTYADVNFNEFKRSSVYKLGDDSKKIDRQTRELKYMLLWTPVDYAPFYYFKDGQKVFTEKKCSSVNCFVTANRSLFGGDLTKFDAIAFNGRNIYNNDFEIPKVRSVRQKYVFFNLESADNYPICSNRFDGFFNWTATYKLDSDIPFPYIQIKNQQDEVVGPKQKMKWLENIDTDEEVDYKHNKSKAVAWFVSNCNSRSNRTVIANKLQEELQPYGWSVDIYGACGQYKCPRLKKNQDCGGMLNRNYYFYLSFENSFADDYVTEKLLTALQNNVVPIVYGGADYNRFLPPGSYLDATKKTPYELASIINKLMLSPSLYNKFFKWKSLYKYRNPSTTDCVCAMCAALNNETFFSTPSYYEDFRYWWNPKYKERCWS